MLECHIVKDLIPNYIDGLLSEKTEQEVAEHIKDCGGCQELYNNMKTPIEEAPIKTDEKEINFLKKIKKKTLGIKISTGVLAVIVVAFVALAWIFAIGFPVSSDDIIITTEIQHPDYDSYLGQEWVVHFELTNGKAIVSRHEPLMTESEDEANIITGCVIELYEAPATNLMHESSNFTWGYSVQGKEAPEKDFTVIVRLKDKDIVYSMTEEGLFEVQ